MREEWSEVHWRGHWETKQGATVLPHPSLQTQGGPLQRPAPNWIPWNLQHQGLLCWRGQPWCQHPHPSDCWPGEEGLLWRPSPVCQLWPLRHDGSAHPHVFWMKWARSSSSTRTKWPRLAALKTPLNSTSCPHSRPSQCHNSNNSKGGKSSFFFF